MDFGNFIELVDDEESMETENTSTDPNPPADQPTSVPESHTNMVVEEASPLTTIIPVPPPPQKRPLTEVVHTDRPEKRSKSSKSEKGKEKTSSFRRSKDDYFTLHLPKSVLTIEVSESPRMIGALATREDVHLTSHLDLHQLEELRCKRLCQV